MDCRAAARRLLPAALLVLLATAPLTASQEGDLRVRIVEPTEETYVSGPTTIRAEVTPVGDTDIASVTFRVDGGVVGVREERPWEVTWDAGAEFQRHIIDVEVVDTVGREAQDSVVTRDLETAVFRAEVSAVLLYVTAVDDRGAYMSGLEADDFEVYEEGDRQTISSFSAEPRPMVAGLLLDTSGSMQGVKIERARQGALTFLQQVDADDEVFVMTFDSFPMVRQELTGNVALLREALSDLQPGGATSMNLAVLDGADILAERPERRALIVLSDGYDTTQSVSVDQAVDYARRQDVRIYTIGIFDTGRGGPASRRFRSGFESINPGERALRAFADGSGGRSYILNSLGELQAAYEDIANELKSQYALAYRPSDPPDPDEWHEIEVRVDGADEVRTKPGYFGGERF